GQLALQTILVDGRDREVAGHAVTQAGHDERGGGRGANRVVGAARASAIADEDAIERDVVLGVRQPGQNHLVVTGSAVQTPWGRRRSMTGPRDVIVVAARD